MPICTLFSYLDIPFAFTWMQLKFILDVSWTRLQANIMCYRIIFFLQDRVFYFSLSHSLRLKCYCCCLFSFGQIKSISLRMISYKYLVLCSMEKSQITNESECMQITLSTFVSDANKTPSKTRKTHKLHSNSMNPRKILLAKWYKLNSLKRIWFVFIVSMLCVFGQICLHCRAHEHTFLLLGLRGQSTLPSPVQ